MCPKSVADKYSWFAASLIFSLGIKNLFDPLQADLGIIESTFGVRIMPARGGCVVQWARCVVAGQIIIGNKDLPSADIHSIAVIVVRLTFAPL